MHFSCVGLSHGFVWHTFSSYFVRRRFSAQGVSAHSRLPGDSDLQSDVLIDPQEKHLDPVFLLSGDYFEV